LSIGTQARADRRVLISAALIGSGVGLALGAAYMAGGMSRMAADHARAQRVAQTAGGAFSEAVLQREASDPAVLALARAFDPAVVADGQDRQLQQLAARLRGAQADPDQDDDARQAARDLDCLTDAVYFEARGESKRGQQAVATVVMNRVKNPNFPKTVCGVVFQRAAGGCQFSFACDGSMRRGREEDAWEEARRVAARALSGYVLREVGSATHFHTADVSPDWGPQMLKVAQVGLHIFYRLNPHAHAQPPAPALPVSAPALQNAVMTSSPLQAPPTLRIATALVKSPPAAPAAPKAGAKPAPAASDAGRPAAAKVAAAPAAKPVLKLPVAPPPGLAKALAAEASEPEPAAATAS
jgi:spore germination cell wall hydrolase CwlJ-like protein